jgi:hypothetical protein
MTFLWGFSRGNDTAGPVLTESKVARGVQGCSGSPRLLLESKVALGVQGCSWSSRALCYCCSDEPEVKALWRLMGCSNGGLSLSGAFVAGAMILQRPKVGVAFWIARNEIFECYVLYLEKGGPNEDVSCGEC